MADQPPATRDPDAQQPQRTVSEQQQPPDEKALTAEQVAALVPKEVG